MPSSPREPAPRRAQPFILVLLAALCLAALAAFAAPWGWPFELFAHFRVQYLAVAVALVALLLSQRRPGLALLPAAVAGFQLWPWMHGAAAAEPARCAGPPLTVVTANLHYENPDKRLFTAWLAAHPADVVALQEVTHDWARQLEVLGRDYPYGRELPREDPYGIALLSRWPIAAVQSVDLAGDAHPSLEATIALPDGQRVTVLALHTTWPVTPRLARERDLALLRASLLARTAAPTPVVAMGDLNLSPDAPEFATLLRDSGLRDAFAGRGWHPTWMAGFWPLALRIDHVLASPGLCVEEAAVGSEIGSDHRPLRVRLQLATRPGYE